MARYHVTYERDETDWWIPQVEEIQACHTQGKTLEQARRRIREALSLFDDDAETAELVEDVRLPPGVRRSLARVDAARKRAAVAQALAAELTAEIAEQLTCEHGFSVRDAGELLGLSHQRVHQLVQGGEARHVRARNVEAARRATKR